MNLQLSFRQLGSEGALEVGAAAPHRQRHGAPSGDGEPLLLQGVDRLVICGMQTEHCIDSTVKVAFEFGYEVILPSGATTTYSNPFLSGEKLINFYERMIWHAPLARVVDMETALSLLSE